MSQNIKIFTICFVFLFIFLFIIALSFLFGKKQNNIAASNIPTNAINSTSQPPVVYNPQESTQALNNLVNRQALSSKDTLVKQNLIILAKGDIVHKATDFTVEYIQPVDEFQVEVNTTNLPLGKQEAEQWLFAQGLSQDGICKMPVHFIVGANAVQELRTENKTVSFSEVADGC